MTRTQKSKLSDNLVDIMTEIEDEILHKIAGQLAADNNISDTSKWRIRQLARAGQLKKESLELIKSYGEIQSESLYEALHTAALDEITNVDRAAQEAITKGFLNSSTDIPADRTAENALKSYYKQAKHDLNMVNTVMGYQASQTFVNAVNDVYGYVHKQLDKGTAKVVMGDESLQTAIRQTIKDLSKHGIPAFVDKRGYHWSPESYVRMDLRTTLGNTANAAQWARCDQFGVNLISVDSHPGARPLCAPYQGRIFSRDGTFGTTTDGSGRQITYSPLSSTSYGQPAGLFGINCGHSSYPFIPGVNVQRYFPVDSEENAARYKELQTQRRLEREIRAGKRECMMLQAAGDDEGYRNAALRLRTSRDKYKAYSNAHGLSLHNDRTQVYGFDRSKSMKTVWAERKKDLQFANYSLSSATEHAKDFRLRMGNSIIEIITTKVDGSVNNIFVDDRASSFTKRPATLKRINSRINKAKKKLGISDSDFKANIVILSESHSGFAGAYNPVTDTLYLPEGIFGKNMAFIQKSGVLPENNLSTVVHEMIHWQDAFNYRKSGNEIHNTADFNTYLNNKFKKRLDRLEETGYNIIGISSYADDSYKSGDFFETYTEYRVKELLGG